MALSGGMQGGMRLLRPNATRRARALSRRAMTKAERGLSTGLHWPKAVIGCAETILLICCAGLPRPLPDRHSPNLARRQVQQTI